MRASTFKAAFVPALFVAVPLTLGCGPSDQGQTGTGEQPGGMQQQPGQPGQPGGGQQPSADVSDAQLETMAQVYVEMSDLQAETAAEAEGATPEEQNQLQAQATEDMQGILDDHGMTIEEYQQMVQLLNSDQQIQQRFEEVLTDIQN
ncbi:MAG: DUF4168 domain-containing protein [Gemmatimonadota bacterium]|nr:DUF4168 domain-containing protein [Gemmatimonadota bacterium]